MTVTQSVLTQVKVKINNHEVSITLVGEPDSERVNSIINWAKRVESGQSDLVPSSIIFDDTDVESTSLLED